MAFPSPEAAQQFLINKITLEADYQGVYLSDSEKTLLQLNLDEPESATGVPVAMLEDNDREYERKFVRIARAAYLRAGENPSERQLFEEAARSLQGTNRYLLVVVSAAVRKEPGAFSFIILVVMAVALAIAALAYAMWKGK